MIKADVDFNREHGDKITFSGNLGYVLAEISFIINTLYARLPDDLGETVKKELQEKIGDNDSPVWKRETGAVSVGFVARNE